MKFTSEDLMKAMGLQVGDRVKLGKRIYEVIKGEDDVYFQSVDDKEIQENLYCVIDLYIDYEILPRPKRVGDLTCNYYKDCDNCPLKMLCRISETAHFFCNLYEALDDLLKNDGFDQEIYDLLKARLDKVVE